MFLNVWIYTLKCGGREREREREGERGKGTAERGGGRGEKGSEINNRLVRPCGQLVRKSR